MSFENSVKIYISNWSKQAVAAATAGFAAGNYSCRIDVAGVIDDFVRTFTPDFIKMGFSTNLTDSNIYSHLKEIYNKYPAYYEANRKFETSFNQTLANSGNLYNAWSETYNAAASKKTEIMVFLGGSAGPGLAAFLAGTIIQIVADIINTFTTIAGYIAEGAAGIYNYVTSANLPEPALAVEDRALSEFGYNFDAKKFMLEDLPALVDHILECYISFMDSMITDAEKWGSMLAHFVLSMPGRIAGTVYSQVPPIDKNAGYWDMFLWQLKMWYAYGTLLGPVIVDILLFFCSGGSSTIEVIGRNLGKIEKVGTAITEVKKISETVSFINTLYKKIPDGLIRAMKIMLTKLYEVIDSIGSFMTRYLSDYYSRIAKNLDKLPSKENLVASFGRLYDRCETLNLFIGLCLLVFGGEINNEGEITT